MLFTKKNNILSISFLSRTFYDEEGINKTDVSLNFSFCFVYLIQPFI
jgi:hypothetical protein